MARPFFKFCKKTCFVCFEVIILTVLACSAILGFGVWRLNHKPVNIDFIAPAIAEKANTAIFPFYMNLGNSYIYWPDLSGPILIGVDGVTIHEKDGDVISVIEEIDISFSTAALFLKHHISPKKIGVHGVTLHARYTEDGYFKVWDNSTDMAMNSGPEDENSIHKQADFNFQEIKQSLPSLDIPELLRESGLYHLTEISVTDVEFEIEDQKIGSTLILPDLSLSARVADDMLSLAFQSRIYASDRGHEGAYLNAEILRPHDTREVQAFIDIAGLNLNHLSSIAPQAEHFQAYDAILNANLTAFMSDDLDLELLNTRVESAQAILDLPEIFEKPLDLENVLLELIYTRDKPGEVVLKHSDMKANGVPLSLSGLASTKENHYQIDLRLQVPELQSEKLHEFWPKTSSDTNGYKWLIERVEDGLIKDGDLTFGLYVPKDETSENGETDLNTLSGTFAFENAKVKFQPDMPAIENGIGTGRLDDNALALQVSTGDISGLKVSDTEISVDRLLQSGTRTVKIKGDLQGPVPKILEVIAKEPLAIRPDQLDPATAKGKANLALDISFPTLDKLKTEDVDFTITGQIEDIYAPAMIGTLPIKGGPLQLTIADYEMSLTGPVQIDDAPADFELKRFLISENQPHEMIINASLTSSTELRNKLGIELSDYVYGPIPLTVTYTDFQDGRAVADVKGNLTQSIVQIDFADYKKPVGQNASLSVQAHFKKGEFTHINQLNIKANQFEMKNGEIFFRKEAGDLDIDTGTIEQLKIGKTDVALKFQYTPEGVLKLDAQGPYVDASPFLNTDEDPVPSDLVESPSQEIVRDENRNIPLIIGVETKKMRLQNDGELDDVEIFMERGRDTRIAHLEMDGKSNGKAVYFRYKPMEGGKRMLQFEADDAGSALKALGIYKNVKGGIIRIYGQAESQSEAIRGKMSLQDFRVVNAPVLARLLNAISLTGFLQLLGNDGINFSRLEGQFIWEDLAEKEMLRFSEGRTSGASIGLTFEGDLNRTDGIIDINGTIVPVSAINGILGNIPLLGKIITGGDGAVFAATYTIEGETEAPDVNVNPLSVLAPGFLRKLFFE